MKDAPPGKPLILEPLLKEEEKENKEENLSGYRDFMGKSDMINQKLHIMKINNEKINELIAKHSKASLEEEKIINEEIKGIINNNLKAQGEIKSLSDKIRQDIENTQKEVDDREDKQEPPEFRMKKQIEKALIAQIQTTLKATNQTQTDYKKSVQDKIKRQLRIAYSDLPEEEIQRISQDPEEGTKMISKQMLGTHEKLSSALSDIKEKYREILQLEKVF